MRALAFALLLTVPSVAAVIGSLGCGGGERSATQAGSQPLPSSQTPRAAPSGGGGGGGGGRAFFGGAAGGRGAREVAGTPRMQKLLRDREARLHPPGPERLGEAQRQAEGRELADGLRTAAAGVEGDECEQAWAAREHMHEELRTRPGETRVEYLRTCRAMPEAERRCQSPTYYADHAQECTTVQQEVGERALRRRIIGGPDGRPITRMPDDAPGMSPTAGSGPPPAAGGADGPAPASAPSSAPSGGPVHVPTRTP